MKNKELVGGQYNELVTMETRENWKAAVENTMCTFKS